MASTYSPNLRIELIGDGEQYDSWGDTTNENLGTVLEDAIAGLVTVSVTSANQALTIVDGSVDQSRNAILSFTTTTSADFSVYAPPVSKLYVINNASAYIATVYNSTVAGNTTAAGVGVAVPAGTTMAIWSNGTNFVSQITHIPSAVLGTGSPSASNFLRGDRVWSAVPEPFPAGTKMLFVQTAAPTGWTKDTTHNDKALRIVSGTASTGGSVAFTTAFASGLSAGDTTLITSQIPAHSHTGSADAVGNHTHSQIGTNTLSGLSSGSGAASGSTANTGGGGAHSHSLTINNTGGGGAHNHTLPSFAVSYVDTIIATKD
jgi:microcystin-dependent protein